MRSLAEKIDMESNKKIDTSDLYETFVENFKLTGILRVDNEIVDFERFKQVYFLNKMNILDLIDLICGVS